MVAMASAMRICFVKIFFFIAFFLSEFAGQCPFYHEFPVLRRCCSPCQVIRQRSLQKTRRREWESVTVTVLPHWRHTKVRCTSFGGTFFLCFQYMRSHRPEQNRLRLSLGSVTATGFPQRAQRKLRRTGAPSGPARSSPVSSPCAFFRHRAEQYRWVHRSARKRFPHTGQTASRFTARPRAQGHAKKTAQKKLSFLYGKSALLRARYGLLHTGRNQSCLCYTPPSGSRTGAAVRRSLRRGSCSSRYPPPSENNPSSRNERSPIFLMDTEIIAGSAHPGQQTAENIRKFSRRFRPDYTTFRPPRVNRRA